MTTPRPGSVVHGGCRAGFSLLELLLAAALAAVLMLGLVHIVTAASAASALQRNQAQIQDHARHAISILSRAIREAGFSPEPWSDDYPPLGLTADNLDGASVTGDRLAVRAWSDLNCFDSRNPDRDSEGNPRFYIRESVFDLSGDQNLARLCRYGPNPAEMTTQVRRQGLLTGVESFQLLYGEDADSDGNVERWVPAGQWSDSRWVLGVRIGLLLASDDAVEEPAATSVQVLDTPVTTPPDGRLRRVFEFAASLRGRLP